MQIFPESQLLRFVEHVFHIARQLSPDIPQSSRKDATHSTSTSSYRRSPFREGREDIDVIQSGNFEPLVEGVAVARHG